SLPSPKVLVPTLRQASEALGRHDTCHGPEGSTAFAPGFTSMVRLPMRTQAPSMPRGWKYTGTGAPRSTGALVLARGLLLRVVRSVFVGVGAGSAGSSAWGSA